MTDLTTVPIGSGFWTGSPCATPWALVQGKPGVQIALDVQFQAGRRHLPVARLRRDDRKLPSDITQAVKSW